MIFTKEEFRPIPSYPTYPPYHTGDYIEDYFYNWFIKNNIQVNRDYIAISWTTLYCENKDQTIQQFLSSLDQTKKYFTVCQHDDAPKHILPKDTMVFSASRSRITDLTKDQIPIPLICSSIPKQLNVEKDIFASFVGSFTHPLRIALYNLCKSQPNYYFSGQPWNPKVNDNKLQEFLHITNRSKFCLCPRGYGNTSFRMYEAMQLGCIPVYISDDFHIPWNDEINWNDIAVLIPSDDILYLPEILKSISEEKLQTMQNNIKKYYNQYFTLDGMCENIIKRII